MDYEVFLAERTWNKAKEVYFIWHRQSHVQLINLWKQANYSFIYIGCDCGWVQCNYMEYLPAIGH